jgi:hypothetical protein
MYSSFSQMKSYCTVSIPLNPIKKTTRGPPSINFLVFSRSSFLTDFFLSLHSVLSLLSMLSSFSAEARSQISVLSSFSAEARNGLGFGFQKTQLSKIFFLFFSQQPATT